MMEPSEQCAYDNDLNPPEDSPSDEERVIVEAPTTLAISQEESEHGPQVYSLSDVQDSEDGTYGIELNGQHFFLRPADVDGEFYVLVPEGQVVTLECAIKQDETIEEESLSTEDISHNIECHSTVKNDQQDNVVEEQGTVVYENSESNEVENRGDVKYLTIREVSNGVAYIQTPPDSFPSTIPYQKRELPEEEIKNEKLLNLAAVAQEIQSADAHSTTSEHIQDLKSENVTEGSVIVSQIHADADTDSVSMYPNSETEEDTATDLASEHDSKSGCCETSTDHNVEAEPISMERPTSFSCISSTRTLDNTVSVIHTTSSTYIHEDMGKDVESSNVSNDYNEKHKLDIGIAESEKSEDSVPDLHVNLNQDNCSNQNDKFSNQDEDSVLSQNCGLDLTKESSIVNPPCEDSLPAVEHTRSRYGIMDSLNKDKQISYYDTNTSEEMEDTINSSSRSTNMTEDGESVSGNNSNDLDCKNIKVGSKMKLSPENLSTEYENSSLKLHAKVIETCDKSNSVIFQDSETVNETNNANEDLLVKKGQQSFHLPSNDNSKNSAFSDNLSSPSLLTKEMNSVKLDLSPRIKDKKVIDAYDFDDSSTEADNDSNPQTSLNCQNNNNKKVFEEETNPKDFGSKILHPIIANEDGNRKLTFHEALSTVFGEDKKSDASFNGSTDLFNNSSEMEVNDEVCENPEETPSNHDSLIPKQKSLSDEVNDKICESQEETLSNHKPSIAEQEKILNENKNVHSKRLDTEKDFAEPCSSKVNDEVDLMDTEASLVKTPQKTYIRKKRKLNEDNIELFSCDDLTTTKDKKTPCTINTQKETAIVFEDPSDKMMVDDDDIESNVQSKVSTTYKRKRRSVPLVVQANRARSLRPRSSHTEKSSENGTVDVPLCDLGDDTPLMIDPPLCDDSEDANWGVILLETQFSSKASSSKPLTATSISPNNSQPSRERKKPDLFMIENSKKSPLSSKKQFDKLIKSPPTKGKGDTAIDTKKLREKVKKQAMSRLSPQSAHIHAKRGRPRAKVSNVLNLNTPLASTSKNLKMTKIKFPTFVSDTTEDDNTVNENPSVSNEVDTPKKLEGKYPCKQCSYQATNVNNLVRHRKYCSSNLEHNYNHETPTDPKKLLRLRGKEPSGYLDTRNGKSKHKNKDISSDNWNGSSTDSLDQPGCSMSPSSKRSDKDKDDAAHDKEKFGFSKRDVVWVKRGKWHWPALVWDIKDKETLFYVISSPNHCEALKIASQSLKKQVHSFDDVTWGKKLLEDAEAMPNHSSFIKAVQKANSYIRRKFLDDADLDAETYFNIKEINEDEKKKWVTEKPVRKATFCNVTDTDITSKDLDIRKVLKCIWEGKCDEHVVSVFHKNVPSERHEMYEKDDSAKELEDMSWFGPFKDDSSMQLRLYDHFYDLYKHKMLGPSNISYIYKVWIPEGIIKAISLVNRISFAEAELIFLKQ